MDPITSFCGSWTFMPDFVLANTRLTPACKLVYCGIARRTRLADDRPEAWPGLEDIAKHTGLSRKAVYTAVKKLVAEGLIKKEHQHKADGGLTSNRYTLIPLAERAEAALSESAPPDRTALPPPVSEVPDPRVRSTPEADTLKQIEEEGARSKTRSHQPRPAERAEVPSKRRDSQGEERPGAGSEPTSPAQKGARSATRIPTAPGPPSAELTRVYDELPPDDPVPKKPRSPKQKVGDAEIALGNLLAERWKKEIGPKCGLPGASTRSVASMRKAGKAVKALKDIAPELLEDTDKLVNRTVTEIARSNGKIQGLCFDMLFPGGNLVKLINGNFRQREEETHFKVPGKEQ